MYKKFTIWQLTTIQNNVIPHIYQVILKESGGNEKDFIWVNAFFNKVAFNEWTDILYFDRNWRDPLLRLQLVDKTIHITDEVDNIQIQVPMDNKSELNSLVNRFIAKKWKQIWQKTIEQLLMDYFVEWNFYSILWKPYLVYDIETALISWEVSDQNFPEYYLWFSMEEVEPWKMQYSCIMKEDLKDFVQKMINFDWYIIGFNQLYFDNPVSVYNAWLSKEEVKIIDEKSLDLYVFFQQLTGRRMGLNKISDALIWVTKTLDSWADVESLWKEWEASNDNKILKKIQEYCKNDVRMTALVMLYLLQFKKVDLDNKEFIFDIPQFIELSRPMEKKITSSATAQSTSLF